MKMGELAKFNSYSIPGLTQSEALMLNHYNNPKVRELTKLSMVKPLVAAIEMARQIKGQSGTAQDDQLAADIVISELKNNISFNNYTMHDVCQAIDQGAKGFLETAGTVHISAENIFKWFIAFNIQIRREAIHKLKQFEARQEIEQEKKQEEDKIKAYEALIISTYKTFVSTGKIAAEIHKGAMYRHLDGKGLIPLTTAEKQAIFKKCEDNYKEHKRKNIARTFEEKVKAKLYGNGNSDKLEATEIKIMAQSEALYIVFNIWKKEKFKIELSCLY